jgi:hypothetical protein
MKKYIVCIVVGLLVAGAVPAQATTVIDDFETGLGLWGVAPDGGAVNTYTTLAGKSPTSGAKFGAVTAGSKDTWVYMYRQVNLEAGKVLKLDYFYDAVGSTADEYAIWLGPSSSWYQVLHEFVEVESNVDVPWTTLSYDIAADTTCYLAIAVRNRQNGLDSSILGVDFIRMEEAYVPPPPPPPPQGHVPEPLTLLGLAMGVGGLTRYAWKK